MVCPRCGATFEGNYCPRCGAPAAAPSVPASGIGVACRRCGTAFQGNFCPRCGLPAALSAYPLSYTPPPSTGGRTFLSVVWTLAIAGVLFLMAVNVVSLLISPTFVVPGIQGMSRGQGSNAGLDAGPGGWTFVDLSGAGASGSYAPTGGNPGGYLQMSLPPGSNVAAMWEQQFRTTGSPPFAARLQLDVQVQTSGAAPTGGRLVATVESVPQGLDLANASAVVPMGGMGWTTTADLDVSSGLSDPGVYYLKVAYVAAAVPSAVTVGLDNLNFAWATDAYFYVIGPIPLPTLLYFSRDPATIEASYLFVFAAVLIPVAYYTIRERKLLARTMTAPLPAIGARLRSMSAWVAVIQTWLAANFFQTVIILLVELLGSQANPPINITAQNTWFYLYDLARASVFEELLFRGLLIGVPMAAASLIWRASKGQRTGLLGSLRYLWGGALRKESPREALWAGGILVLVSSAIFGIQHNVGWGLWKVLPAAVIGLALGYVFLRHGIGAAILVHFLNDYLTAFLLEGIGGLGLEIVFAILFYTLVAVGGGFFVWYVIDAWQHIEEFRGRRGPPHLLRVPSAVGAGGVLPPRGGPYPPMPPPGMAPPWMPPPTAPPTAPPPGASDPAPAGWSTPPAVPIRRNPNLLPQGYTPSYRAAPFGYPPVRFQCPYCGWVEAKYENRVFTCLRCGRTA